MMSRTNTRRSLICTSPDEELPRLLHRADNAIAESARFRQEEIRLTEIGMIWLGRSRGRPDEIAVIAAALSLDHNRGDGRRHRRMRS